MFDRDRVVCSIDITTGAHYLRGEIRIVRTYKTAVRYVLLIFFKKYRAAELSKSSNFSFNLNEYFYITSLVISHVDVASADAMSAQLLKRWRRSVSYHVHIFHSISTVQFHTLRSYLHCKCTH